MRLISEIKEKGEDLIEACAVFLTDRIVRVKDGKRRQEEIEKWKLAEKILLAGVILAPILGSGLAVRQKTVPDYVVERPEKGQGDQTVNLQVTTNEKDQEKVTDEVRLQIKERIYSDREIEQIFQAAKAEIDRTVIGENESPDEVRKQLVLPLELQDGAVTVQWVDEPQGLIDENGIITENLPEEGSLLTLKALMSCEGVDTSYEFALHLMPVIRDENEQFQYDLQKAAETAERENPEQSSFKLPTSVDGKELQWVYPGTRVTGICFAAVLLFAAAGYFGKEQEYRKQKQNRQRSLLLDYPDVVFKLSMLLNTGLTMKNAFTKIAAEYREAQEREKKRLSGVHHPKKRWAYEEMLITCNEMKSGIPEAKAYENFGRRCGENCYIRLGSTLSGSLQKSSEGLTNLLLQESETAMEERRLLAKKLGEEAGTRLLLPMILMLLVVLVILMVPAVLSF